MNDNKLINLSNVLNLPLDFELTDEFKNALALMEDTRRNIFLTGKAGTGKSTLIAYFRTHTSKKVVALSPTGIAAMNIGGQTIHSFFDFPLKHIDPRAIHKSKKLADLYSKVDTIIVDEVSMVRADMIDGMDKSLKINRGSKLPFGGVQMIFVGDMFQLPPVLTKGDDMEYIKSNYESPYFFSAKSLKSSSSVSDESYPKEQFNMFEASSGSDSLKPLVKIGLSVVFRQKDLSFQETLNKIRVGVINQDELNKFNKEVHIQTDYTEDENDFRITLTTTNAKSDFINFKKLGSINEESFSFNASVEGDFSEKLYPTSAKLELKIGAQVMMLKNDAERRWVNGSLGVITKLGNELIMVKISSTDKEFEVRPESWRQIKYQFIKTEQYPEGRIEEVEIGSFRQIPIRLAWAVTIHKSQGQSFEKLNVDLGTGAFAHGQAYVALSRARNIDGLRLISPLRKSDLLIDRTIINWLMTE
jgi:hypothetical protein